MIAKQHYTGQLQTETLRLTLYYKVLLPQLSRTALTTMAKETIETLCDTCILASPPSRINYAHRGLFTALHTNA